MPSRTYTNADTKKYTGTGRETFGKWIRTSPLTKKDDPYEGFVTGGDNLDEILAGAKGALSRGDRLLGRVRADADTRITQDADYSRAEASAWRDARDIRPVLRRTADAAALPLSIIPNPAQPVAGAYLAARGVQDFADNPNLISGGMAALGTLPFVRPVRNALGRLRASKYVATHATPRSWQQGTDELGDMAIPAAEAPQTATAATIAAPQSGRSAGLRGFLGRMWDNTADAPTPKPTGDGAPRLNTQKPPALNDVLIDALESTRTPSAPMRVSSPVAADVVPRAGTASAAESLARQRSQLGRLRSQSGPTAPVPGVPSTARPSAGITDPARMLPAFGETTETAARGFTRGDKSAIPGPKRFLRPEDRTIDLATEYAQREIGPGARVTGLKSYIRPSGDDELARALRQRAHIDSSARTARQRFNSESGLANPRLLAHIASTGIGGAVGAANPEMLGSDDDEYIEGAIKGAFGGLIAPGVARGVGRIAKAAPNGVKPLLKQTYDEYKTLRYMGMLSGYAIPKSIMGNVAAPFWRAAENGSLAPIKQAFSPRTVKDYFSELANPSNTAPLTAGTNAPNLFGRILNAGDTAMTKALRRGGATEAQAAEDLLRTPTGELVGHGTPLQKFLSSETGKFAIPFQTTPINQGIHGLDAMRGAKGTRQQILAGVAGALGAGQGALTDASPTQIALTSPLAGKYSVPYLIGAGGARYFREGGRSAANAILRGVSPVPEIGAGIFDPSRPLRNPASRVWFDDKSSSRRRKTITVPRRATRTTTQD